MRTGSIAQRWKKYAIALICVASLVVNSPLVFQGAAAASAAGGSVLSLSPATGAYGVGQTLSITIMLNTNGESINAIEVDLSFPADKLQVTSLDYTTGGVLMFALDDSYDNATGHIRLAGGLPSPGFTGATGHVATITFHTKAAGTANVTFDATSAVLRNSDSANVLAGTQPGQFTIADGAAASPGILISPAALLCAEGGPSVTYAVQLASQPASVVTITPSADPQLHIAPASLVFTPASWSAAQLVTVAAVDDTIPQGTRTVTIQNSAASSDPLYQGLNGSAVAVTIADNDVAATDHTITASVAGTGGTISPSGKVAVQDGAAMRFVIKPDAGYEIDTVTVDGAQLSAWDRTGIAYDFSAVTADHTITCAFRLTKDVTPPALVLTGLAASGTPQVTTASVPWQLAVRATDDRGPVTVTVSENGSVLATQSAVAGAATLAVQAADGDHLLTITATDGAGNVTSRQVELVVDTTGPVMTLSAVPSRVTTSRLDLRGKVADALSGVASLSADGSALQWSADGSFSYQATLKNGENSIELVAVDKLGNRSVQTVSLTYVSTMTIVLRIGQLFMTVDGQKMAIDPSSKVAPIIQNGRTLLPIRALIEALGGTAGWDAASRKATITLKSTVLQLWIGKSTATVRGHSIPIDAKDKKVVPVIVQGRTFLPLRFIAENLGLNLVWDGTARTITLTVDRT